MIEDLSFHDVSLASTTWEQAKHSESFEQLGIGTILRLFELKPEFKTAFGFDINSKIDSSTVGMVRMAILIHGKDIIDTVDAVFGALGPDIDILTELLAELATSHKSFGADYFRFLGIAVGDVLQPMLGETKWTRAVQRAWSAVFQEVSTGIAKAMGQEVVLTPVEKESTTQIRPRRMSGAAAALLTHTQRT